MLTWTTHGILYSRRFAREIERLGKKQTIPHTGGAMALSRRRDILRIETGKIVGRGEMWNITHKRKDGSYVNDEVMEIEKIDEYLSQHSEDASDISPNDAIGVIFGKEHLGRVRGLGLGVCPTIVFKHTTLRLSGMNLGSSSATTSNIEEKVVSMETEVATVKSQMQTLLAYIALKEGGNILEEIAALFPTNVQQAADVGSGAASPNDMRRSSGGSNVDLAGVQNPPN
ncbi:transposase, Ptta/En/Spm, plant [Spatholobus suberectus]|nr:transposase, Ptta/En/Spm, plant [Spatholobus suberectus]